MSHSLETGPAFSLTRRCWKPQSISHSSPDVSILCVVWISFLTKVTAGKGLFGVIVQEGGPSIIAGDSRQLELEAEDETHAGVQLSFSIYTVQDPSQGMEPLALGGSLYHNYCNSPQAWPQACLSHGSRFVKVTVDTNHLRWHHVCCECSILCLIFIAESLFKVHGSSKVWSHRSIIAVIQETEAGGGGIPNLRCSWATEWVQNQPVSHRDPPISVSQVLGLQAHATWLFEQGFWAWSSCLHACVFSAYRLNHLSSLVKGILNPEFWTHKDQSLDTCQVERFETSFNCQQQQQQWPQWWHSVMIGAKPKYHWDFPVPRRPVSGSVPETKLQMEHGPFWIRIQTPLPQRCLEDRAM